MNRQDRSGKAIVIRGARQNNLRGIDLEIPLGRLTVVTGVSGSGKSSLAFDTLYAEGQRRYVETFSSYARQFLDRMDRPRVDRIEGIPPAVAIDQTNPVRTSRSTVGTMTELNDHLKLLFARAARLHCRGCAAPVGRDTPAGILGQLHASAAPGARLAVLFPVQVPDSVAAQEARAVLAREGYTRVHEEGNRLQVVQDRLRLDPGKESRLLEALEIALERGAGRVAVQTLDGDGSGAAPWRFSTDLHCAACDIHYRDARPSLFSFNSPLGACPTCRGFGRTMGIDWGLVVPDETRTLAAGAIKPWQTRSYAECQRDLLRFARRRGVPTERPWHALDPAQRQWVIEGEGPWDQGVWYGARRFFAWLESKSYRMHVRVLLSRYRAYTTCPECHGARLKPEALLWRLDTTAAPAPAPAARAGAAGPPPELLPGRSIHDLAVLPIRDCQAFFAAYRPPAPLDQATDLLLGEIRTRLGYLVDVGLGYLSLDRQSRTLSGGEVQRINLTTALGTSLVNSLFVLDEPSIGLHARDLGRVVGILERLREAGNTLVVVEHDAQLMRAADHLVDIGPGPGEHGGRLVYAGPPAGIEHARGSLTGAYLAGRRSAPAAGAAVRSPTGGSAGAGQKKAAGGPAPGHTDAEQAWLQIEGAAAHNLRTIDVRLPLGQLVCVTGVSGSGKSTLIGEVLYRGLLKLAGRPTEAPGRHDAIRGWEAISDVVLIDQAPIGRTARSNPASYVGAFDAIRKAFAAEPEARRRGYTAGTFSFNAGNGRCPACSGNGFEHVEMQFLADVYLRCPECDGRRYRAEVLEVKLAGAGGAGARSIAEVLEMTVAEAIDFFAGDAPRVRLALEPLQAVGLGYLRLGQPLPTLSGGEAQRLKLAGYMTGDARRRAGAARGAGKLFLFDEPTTGLHFADIETLLGAFRRLLAQGHSLIVIEHNLDVIAAADWIVDLGPEGGDAGGAVVCAGTPAEVARHGHSHTGAALRACFEGARRPRPRRSAKAPTARGERGAIAVHQAREHNLRGIDVRIPRDRFTVITGVSGSGKSTLAFDILFAEGQRRYLETLNAYARQFVQPAARADVDAVFGIPPTVAIAQRTSRGGRKSTVATLTEIHHFLRLLFVRLGTQHCPACAVPIDAQTPAAIVDRVQRDYRGRRVQVLAPLVVARKGYYTELARWAARKGFAALRVDGNATPTDAWPRLDRFREHDIDLPIATLTVGPRNERALRGALERALELGKGSARVAATGARARGRLYSTRRACPGCGRSFPAPDPRLLSFNSRHGWCPRCYGTGAELAGFDADQSGEERWWNEWWEGEARICRACDGARLNPEALAVRFAGRTIAELTALPIERARSVFERLRLDRREAAIARDAIAEIRARLDFLAEVGLGYLSLDRAAPTLSGGEAQRIRLAAQLGSNLRGVCYILDEPTIGLHPRDNRLLIDTLRRLQAKGNTVVVVEHDEDTIRAAEHIIDLGPGAGAGGGQLVAAGTLGAITRSRTSVTGRALRAPLAHPLRAGRRRPDPERMLRITGADRHNLHGIDVEVPLGLLVCVTGVSGSGKSTLVREVLHDNLARALGDGRRRRRKPAPCGCAAFDGAQALDRVLEVDQTPIGKTPRSCPATYIGIWDHVRRLFAQVPESRMRGWSPGRFSFNVTGGRCPACEGQGTQRLEMSFLPDVQVACELCAGARFESETLNVHYRGRSVAEVLAMRVTEAAALFANHPPVAHALGLLEDVGLGYLTLGQPSPTLSGGEAQRIKLVTELAKARSAAPTRADPGPRQAVARPSKRTLYVLDEPTVGLHMADVERLIHVLHRLVDAGHSVVLIEHNLDVVAEADWILDLGPEGGSKGGRIVARGTPERVARAVRRSHTARILAGFLQARGTRRPGRPPPGWG